MQAEFRPPRRRTRVYEDYEAPLPLIRNQQERKHYRGELVHQQVLVCHPDHIQSIYNQPSSITLDSQLLDPGAASGGGQQSSILVCSEFELVFALSIVSQAKWDCHFRVILEKEFCPEPDRTTASLINGSVSFHLHNDIIFSPVRAAQCCHLTLFLLQNTKDCFYLSSLSPGRRRSQGGEAESSGSHRVPAAQPGGGLLPRLQPRRPVCLPAAGEYVSSECLMRCFECDFILYVLSSDWSGAPVSR
ncbi:hypothetical protein GOODEAATRI_022596 [Goodea atripinnis]|uniref:Uncharacterized protein n=1 Tax=Goodea atripinnis TaxID=208336 RepID=A0ABV0PQU5_9TELE